MTPIGAQAVLRAAPTSLLHLDLADSTLCSDDLAVALRRLTSLVRLDVADTEIEGANMEPLTAALCYSADATLRTLYVDDWQRSEWVTQARQHKRLTVYLAEMPAKAAAAEVGDEVGADTSDEWFAVSAQAAAAGTLRSVPRCTCRARSDKHHVPHLSCPTREEAQGEEPEEDFGCYPV